MSTLTPLDAAFLRLEDGSASLHIASVAIFDGPMPERAELNAHYLRRIDLVPRFGQRLHEAPLRLGAPSWVPDPEFELEDHLRWTALPHPGTLEQLDDLVGRLMAQPLDRCRPLWEAWFVEGLEGGRWAMISKVHHSMVDGIGGTDLLGAILDASAQPGSGPAVRTRPHSGKQTLDVRATHLPRELIATSRSLIDTVRNPQRIAAGIRTTAHGLLSFAGLAVPAPSSSLMGPLGRRRSWGTAVIDLDDVRTVRQALGGTVNDVVLSAITKGFRDVLLSHGEIPDKAKVRTLIPVSVRTPGQRGTAGNRVTALVAELPVHVCSPQYRLESVRAELGRLKASGEPQAGVLITQLAGLLPQGAVNFALSLIFRFPQRFLVTVATNVPGPRGPLYLLGRRLRELYPYVPIADRVRVGVAVTSYDGMLYVGVTGDRDHVRDVSTMTRAIEDEIRELVKLAAT